MDKKISYFPYLVNITTKFLNTRCIRSNTLDCDKIQHSVNHLYSTLLTMFCPFRSLPDNY